MSFADLVEEVRALPIEAKTELREVLREELMEAERDRLYRDHLESVKEWESGNRKTYSNADDFIRSLEDSE
jgi:hypothetical protein